jgi:hypothetical protein
VLGAAACYYAGIGDHIRASEYCEKIGALLGEDSPGAQLPVHLNELLQYYDRHDLPALCARQAARNAKMLESAAMWEVAALTYAFACNSAATASKGHLERYFSLFLECSKQLGIISNRRSDSIGYGDEAIAIARQNTFSMWRQFEERGRFRLALAAYRAAQAWDPRLAEAGWERLGDALHPLNLDAVKELAAAGEIRRDAYVEVNSKGECSIQIRTYRTETSAKGVDSRTGHPDTVWGYWPIDAGEGVSVREGDATAVAGTMVYSLRPGDEVTIDHSQVRSVRTDGQGRFLYRDCWGSRNIMYKVRVHFDTGLIPLQLEIDTIRCEAPRAWIWFDANGCTLEFEPIEKAWLADVAIAAVHEPKLNLADKDSSFTRRVPFSLYRIFVAATFGSGRARPR